MGDIELARNSALAPTVADLAAEVEAAHAAADELGRRSGDLEAVGGTPEERRDALNTLRAEMDNAQARLQRATRELSEAMQAQLAQLNSVLEPLREQSAQLMSAVEAISLYLGSDEQIHLLRDGEQAAADTPITVYQTTLYMDEEMALAAEAAGIADATIEPGSKGWARFDDWLLADDANVRQVCPAERGIVAFRSAREQRRHGIEYMNGDGSDVTHFLVVNGEQLAWVIASYDFAVGDQLVPSADQFDKHFHSRWERDEHGQPAKLRPGTPEWDRAQREAEADQKHFLKIALILQGLVDRSTLLSPLPSDAVSFTSIESYEAGHIVVVTDDAGNQLPSGVIAFPEWRRRIMAELEPGQRVVLGHISHDTLYGGRDYGAGVLHPRTADHPPTGVPLEVRRRPHGRLAVAFKRTDTVYKRNVPVPDQPGYEYRGEVAVPATGYASVELSPGVDWALAIDHPMVTIEAIEWYLLSRENRRHFQSLVPLLRSARQVLVAEAETEAPFFELLCAEAARRNNVTVDDIAETVSLVVSWWKTKRRQHRPLVSADGDDAGAYTEILAEVDRRVALDAMEDNVELIERIAAECHDAMYIGRRHDGTYLALVPADERDVYVHVRTWSAKRGAPGPIVEWTTAPDVRAYKALRSTERFATWPRFVDTSNDATGPERDRLVELVRAAEPDVLAIEWQHYWSSYGNGTKWVLEAVVAGPAPEIDHDNPITGTSKHGQLLNKEFSWERTADGVTISERQYQSSRTAITETRGEAPDDPIWIDRARFDAVVGEYREQWKAHEAIAAPLRAAANAATKAVETAWGERAVDREYRAFLVKYGAESTGRWDAHRKTITGRLQYPHQRSGLNAMFAIAAEAGLLEQAGTVAEVVDALTAAGLENPLDDDTLADVAELTI